MALLLRTTVLAGIAFWGLPAAAQGPCAEATVAVLGASHTPLRGAEVAFHPVLHRSTAAQTAVADSVVAEAAYTGRTDVRGAFVLRRADVGEYVVRVRGRRGAAGEARLFCASASRSRVLVRLAEAAQ